MAIDVSFSPEMIGMFSADNSKYDNAGISGVAYVNGMEVEFDERNGKIELGCDHSLDKKAVGAAIIDALNDLSLDREDKQYESTKEVQKKVSDILYGKEKKNREIER